MLIGWLHPHTFCGGIINCVEAMSIHNQSKLVSMGCILVRSLPLWRTKTKLPMGMQHWHSVAQYGLHSYMHAEHF